MPTVVGRWQDQHTKASESRTQDGRTDCNDRIQYPNLTMAELRRSIDCSLNNCSELAPSNVKVKPHTLENAQVSNLRHTEEQRKRRSHWTRA